MLHAMETKRLYVEVDAATHRRMRIIAAKDDKPVSKLAAEAILAYLAKRDAEEASEFHGESSQGFTNRLMGELHDMGDK